MLQLRFYKDVKGPDGKSLDCLGSGGNDPLSATLKQIEAGTYGASKQWGFWNDDFSKTAAETDEQKWKCGAGHGHSKGAVGYDESSGFILQATTPNYPVNAN